MTVSTPSKPETFNGDLANLPEALEPLTRLHRWCVWKWEWKQDKWTKVPYQARYPSVKAKSNDPSTWGSSPAGG
jgi:primase-polymerase (primpol)-like protein